MAKKKLQHPNKKRNNLITAAVSGGLLILLAALVGLNIAGRNYIIKMDGVKVSVKEYKLCLYLQKLQIESLYGDSIWNLEIEEGVTLAQDSTGRALQALFQRRVAVNEFRRLGLSLTAEQKEEAVKNRQVLRDNLTPRMLDEIGMSMKQLLVFCEEELMYSALYDYVTKDFSFDGEAFSEYYEEYLVDNIKSLNTVNVNYILTDSLEKAEEALAKAKKGESIYNLIKQYSADYEAPGEDAEKDGDGNVIDPRMEPSDAWYVDPIYDNDLIDEIYKLKEGEFSEIFEFHHHSDDEDDHEAMNYLFVYVDNIEYPDYAELKEEVREKYIDEEKGGIFSDYFWAIAEDIYIEENTDLINKIDIRTLPV